MSARLSARAIRIDYAQTGTVAPVLDGIDLDVSPSEIVSVLGPSGCGKSSLLRVLAGLQRPTSGTVSVEGEIYSAPRPDIALAFQDPCLLPWLDVERNIGLGLGFRHQPRIDAARKRARIDRVLDEVELRHARHTRPLQLSGGMAQRVALARCLAREPRVLLLDEPFGALDESTREEMQLLLMRIVKRSGTATVLVTHDIDESLRVSDHIVLLGMQARTAGHWRLDATTSRDPADPRYVALRDEIWRALHEARRRESTAPAIV